jgi:hypothetical protein
MVRKKCAEEDKWQAEIFVIVIKSTYYNFQWQQTKTGGFAGRLFFE